MSTLASNMENSKLAQPHKVTFRYAEHRDYDQVIRNLQPLFGGFDYLIVNYHNLIRDPNVHNFVAEVDGKVVAYRALVFDGPKEMVGIGGRIHADYAGKGIYIDFEHKSNNMILEKFPSLEVFTGTTMHKREEMKDYWQTKGFEVVEHWQYPFWCTTKEQVAKLIAALDRVIPTLPVTTPSAEETLSMLCSPNNSKSLFPSGYIIAYYNWLPKRVNLDNMRHFVGAHRVLLSMESPQQVALMSFLVSQKIPRGNLSGIHFYQNGADLYTCLGHLSNHLQHIINITRDNDEIILNINSRFGDDTMKKVKNILYQYLGSHQKSDIFHHDSFVFALSHIKKKAKL